MTLTACCEHNGLSELIQQIYCRAPMSCRYKTKWIGKWLLDYCQILCNIKKQKAIEWRRTAEICTGRDVTRDLDYIIWRTVDIELFMFYQI